MPTFRSFTERSSKARRVSTIRIHARAETGRLPGRPARLVFDITTKRFDAPEPFSLAPKKAAIRLEGL